MRMFVPKSVLDTSVQRRNVSLILHYNKTGSPYSLHQPHFTSLFGKPFVFWKVPRKFRRKEFTLGLEVSMGNETWKEVLRKNLRGDDRRLVKLNLAKAEGTTRGKMQGRLVYKTDKNIFQSNPFDMDISKSWKENETTRAVDESERKPAAGRAAGKKQKPGVNSDKEV